MDAGIQRRELRQRLRPERLRLHGRRCGQRFAAQDLDWLHRGDAEDASIFADPRPPPKADSRCRGHGGSSACVPREFDALTRIQTAARECIDVGRDLGERVIEEPLDECVQSTLTFEDVQHIVIPAILADQSAPAWRCVIGKHDTRRTARERVIVHVQLIAVEPEATAKGTAIIDGECVASQHTQSGPIVAKFRGQRHG